MSRFPIRLPGKRSKYGVAAKENRTLDGIVFDSKAEMLHYSHLKQLQDLGQIADLKLQPEFPLIINGIDCGKYIADFAYYASKGAYIVADVKGVSTAVFKLKKKLMLACYGIRIQEIGK